MGQSVKGSFCKCEDLNSPVPRKKKQFTALCACNPRAKKKNTKGTLGLSGQ